MLSLEIFWCCLHGVLSPDKWWKTSAGIALLDRVELSQEHSVVNLDVTQYFSFQAVIILDAILHDLAANSPGQNLLAML